MSGLVRGACVSGGWSLSESARESMVNRLADTLLSTSFHWGKEIGEPRSRAKSVEARAYATAQVASTTTTGDRPHVEGVRIYTREAGKLVQALLREAGRVGCAPAAGEEGEATTLSLHSSDREFLTAERAEELLAPLLAPGAPFTKARGARGGAPKRARCFSGSLFRAAFFSSLTLLTLATPPGQAVHQELRPRRRRRGRPRVHRAGLSAERG